MMNRKETIGLCLNDFSTFALEPKNKNNNRNFTKTMILLSLHFCLLYERNEVIPDWFWDQIHRTWKAERRNCTNVKRFKLLF